MAGGMGGAFGQKLIDTGIRFGGKAPVAERPAVTYTPVTPNVYVSPFSSIQSNQSPTSTAPVQQIQQAGLQALMANMMSQYPAMRGQLATPPQGFTPQPAKMQPMPQYRAPALSYRPNMQPAQQSLNRVAVSVAEQQRRAAVAEADRLRAELAAQQSYYGD